MDKRTNADEANLIIDGPIDQSGLINPISSNGPTNYEDQEINSGGPSNSKCPDYIQKGKKNADKAKIHRKGVNKIQRERKFTEQYDGGNADSRIERVG